MIPRAHRLTTYLIQKIVAFSGRAHVTLKWPLSSSRPFTKPFIKLWSPGKGVGDEVMCTMVFDAIKEANPGCKITFVTRYPDLFRGHPSIDNVIQESPEARKGGIPLVYALVLPPPRRPLGHLMAECVGLLIDKPRVPTLPHAEVSIEFQTKVAALKKPLVAVQPRPSNWTPNKDWPLERWDVLVGQLTCEGATVVECGTLALLSPAHGLVSMAGTTSLLEFAYLVSQSDLFIAPPSGGMHLAAAYGIPSVILYGGYEDPVGHQYPRVTALYRKVSCAPCWLTTPCPRHLECQAQISVADVLSKTREILDGPHRAFKV